MVRFLGEAARRSEARKHGDELNRFAQGYDNRLIPRQRNSWCVTIYVPMRGVWLFVRSAFWTIAFPGFLAGVIPWRYFGVSAVRFRWSNPAHLVGALLVALGAALLLVCIYEFARRGRGTLSPVDPPKELVVQGLYRYVRNPMYLSVLTIVAGEIILTRSVALLVYWLVFLTCATLFVRGYEEPYLRRQFGESYERYTRSVGRWFPRF